VRGLVIEPLVVVDEDDQGLVLRSKAEKAQTSGRGGQRGAGDARAQRERDGEGVRLRFREEGQALHQRSQQVGQAGEGRAGTTVDAATRQDRRLATPLAAWSRNCEIAFCSAFRPTSSSIVAGHPLGLCDHANGFGMCIHGQARPR